MSIVAIQHGVKVGPAALIGSMTLAAEVEHVTDMSRRIATTVRGDYLVNNGGVVMGKGTVQAEAINGGRLSVIPEPATLLLLVLSGMAWMGRRRRGL